MKPLILILLLIFPVVASAQTNSAPKSIADCENVKGDLAYNQCLASFGPAMRSRPGIVAPGQDPEEVAPVRASQGRQAARRGRAIRGRQAYRGGRAIRGRQSASFEIGSRRVRASKPSRRSYRHRR